MQQPPLLMSRPVPTRVALAAVVPAGFGAIVGVVLGISEPAYLGLSVVAAIGGYLAGYEHHGAGEGALRGMAGGGLYGGGILLAHVATGAEAKAKLPHPAIVLLAFTVIAGVVLGAFGGSARQRRDQQLAEDENHSAFDLTRLKRGEYVGFLGAGILFFSLYLPWFSTSCASRRVPKGCNVHSVIKGQMGDFTAWQTFSKLDLLLVAACSAPFVLAWIVVRGHALAWRPGEITMIVGMIAFVLILLNGIVLGKPGTDPVEISLQYGYLVGLLGAVSIMAGGVIRQGEGGLNRKPPGVI